MRTVRERMELHRDEPGVHVVPPDDRSDRPGARELRRHRRVADQGQRRADRSRPARSTTARRWPAPADLQQALMKRSDVLVRTFTENLATYALGRRLAASDMPMVRAVVRRAAADDYKLSAFVTAIVTIAGVSDEERGRAGGDHRRSAAVSTTTANQGSPRDVVHHREARGAADDAAGPGRDGGAAVPGRDGAGARAAERHGDGRLAGAAAAGGIEMVHGAAGSSPWGATPAPVVAGGGGDGLRPRRRRRSARWSRYRKYLTIVSDTDVRNAEAFSQPEIGGDHFRSSAVFLTQAHPRQTESSDVRAGVSLDQLYAQQVRPGHADSRRCSCASRTSTRPAAAPTATRASTPT